MNEPLMRHIGKVENGKLLLNDISLYNKNLNRFEGMEVELTIQEKFEDATNDQHAYYRGAILPTALQHPDFAGWTKKSLHKFLTGMFLGEIVQRKVNGKGYEIPVVESTANISKRRMAEFIEEVLQFLSQMDIYIEDPEKYKLTKYKTKTWSEGKENS